MRRFAALLSIAFLACADGRPDGTTRPDGNSVMSSPWAGTWTIVIGTYNDNQPATPSPTGHQGILAIGSSIEWTNFAHPSIPACNLTATPMQTVLDLSTLSCAGYVFAPGSQALFSNFNTGPEINVTASGTEPGGGEFQLTMRLQ